MSGACPDGFRLDPEPWTYGADGLSLAALATAWRLTPALGYCSDPAHYSDRPPAPLSSASIRDAIYAEVERYGMTLAARAEWVEGEPVPYPAAPTAGLLAWTTGRIFTALLDHGVDLGDWQSALYRTPEGDPT